VEDGLVAHHDRCVHGGRVEGLGGLPAGQTGDGRRVASRGLDKGDHAARDEPGAVQGANLGGLREGGRARDVREEDVGAALEEEAHAVEARDRATALHVGRARALVAHGEDERGATAVVEHVNVGAVAQEDVQDHVEPARGRVVQRGAAAPVHKVDVHPVRAQERGARLVANVRRNVEQRALQGVYKDVFRGERVPRPLRGAQRPVGRAGPLPRSSRG
jgi:hypothetical protein